MKKLALIIAGVVLACGSLLAQGTDNVSDFDVETWTKSDSGISAIMSIKGNEIPADSSIILSHNNANLSSNTSDIPSGIDKRLNRVWHLEVHKNFIGDINFNTISLGIADGNALRLLVDADGNFSDADTVSGIYDNTNFIIYNHNFQDGYYYTLGLTSGANALLMEFISLKIKITDLRNNNGNVALQLFDLNGELIKGKIEKIENKECTVLIDSLTTGKYAIRYFHDENSNDKLDTNWLGIPKEGYGFSNNAKAFFGAPSFESRLFELNSDMEINLKPTY